MCLDEIIAGFLYTLAHHKKREQSVVTFIKAMKLLVDNFMHVY